MTRRVLASAAIGRYEELLNIAFFNIKEFADKYGYEISICRKNLDLSRPPAWTKILHILDLMQEFDEILWIDSDAIIVDSSNDITSEIDVDTELAWVEHKYDDQISPNSGVMYIRVNANTKKLFKFAYDQTDLIEHPWWDQAALMRLLKIHSKFVPLNPGKIVNDLEVMVQKISGEWNSIRQASTPNPKIRHFAGESFSVRKLFMAEYANPRGSAGEILEKMINLGITPEHTLETMYSLHEQHRQLEEQHRQLEEQHRQLEEQYRQIEEQHRLLDVKFRAVIDSNIWKIFTFWRWIRSIRFLDFRKTVC